MPAALQGLDPWFINQAVTSRDARQPFAAAFGHNLAGAGSEGGVVQTSTGRLSVSATTPSASMAVSISTGFCVVPRGTEGVYNCALWTAGSVDIDPADATNPRIDTIIARVRDLELGDPANSLGNRGFNIEVEKGTPAASPTPKDLSAIPAYIALADVYVPNAGAMPIPAAIVTGNVTDRRHYAKPPGGVRYAALAAAVARAGAYPWDLRVNASGQFDGWDDSAAAWVPLLTSRAPTTYTPTWTMGTPTGASTGRYVKTGRMVEWDAVFVAQAGVSLDVVSVTVTLPFPAASGTSTAGSLRSWSNGGFTYPAGLWRPVDVVVSSGVSNATLFGRNGSGQLVTPGTAGFSLAAGDSISVSGRYWAAA
jgi:hypothetical protein